MKRSIFKDKIVRNYAVILSVALLIPLILSVFLLQYTVRYAASKAEENNLMQLRKMQEQVDENLNLLRSAVIRISQNEMLLALGKSDFSSQQDIYNTYLLMRELESEVGRLSFCKGFYLYINEPEIVFYNGLKHRSSEFFKNYIKTGQFETWQRKLSEKYFEDFYTEVGLLNQLSENGIVEYRYSYPIGKESAGTIVFLLDKGIFISENIKRDYQEQTLELYVFDKKLQIIYANTDASKEKAEKYAKLLDDMDETDSIGKKQIYRFISGVANLRYLFVDNGSIELERVNRILMFPLFFIIAILIVGGIYVFAVVRNISKRNKEVYKLIGNQHSSKDVLGWNVIVDAIGELSDKRISLEKMSRAKNDMEKNRLWIELLFGNEKYKEKVIVDLMEAGITLDADGYLLAMGTLHMSADEEDKNIKFLICNILNDLTAETFKWHFIDYNMNQFILVFYGSFDENSVSQIENTCNMLAGYAESILNVNLELDLGEICHDIGQVQLSGRILRENYENRMLYNPEQITEDNDFTQRGNYVYSQREENELMSLVLSGSADEAELQLSNIISKHKSAKPFIRKILFYHLVGTLFKCAEQLKIIELSEDIERELSSYSKNSQEFESIIKKYFRKVCQQAANTENNGKLNAFSIRMMNYIDANFRNPILSLKTLSGEFGVTVSYVSRVFKERVGDNFSNYLLNKRIEKAMELLEKTNLSIGEIAQEIGYIDSSAFIKNFKKIMKVTPGMYREKIKNSVSVSEGEN